MKYFLLILSLFSTQVFAAKPTLDYKSMNHSDYEAMLNAYVSDGWVNYNGFKDDERLPTYIKQIADLDPDSLENTSEELSFLINAYNALSIKGILKGRSPSTFFGKAGFFVSQKYIVSGKKINLYDLEHKKLRKLDEPRIHFALVCSSYSCPALQSEAYNVEELDQQLEASTKQFINDITKNRFDRKKKVARLSKIFDWFKKDFTATGLTVQQYIAQYIEDETLAEELRNNDYKIKYMKYNWKLNGDFKK